MSWKVRKYRGGPAWEYDVRIRIKNGPDVRERKKTGVSSYSGSVDVAKARERALLDEVLHPAPVHREVPTLRQFWTRYIDQYVKVENEKASTYFNKQSMYNAHMTCPLGEKISALADVRLDCFQPEDVQRFKQHLRKTMQVPSANRNLILLHHVLKTAVEWKVIPTLPCPVPLLKEPVAKNVTRSQYYDFDEYERVRRAGADEGLRSLILVLLGGDAGLRFGEMRALRRRNVDLTRGCISITENVYLRKGVNYFGRPKGGLARELKMTSRLRSALAEWFRTERWAGVVDMSTFVLNPGRRDPMCVGTVRNALMRVQRRAGVRAKGAAHILRHTFCSHLAMKGAPAVCIKELAGHRTLKSTEIYMHLSPTARDLGIGLLDATA